MTPCDVAIVGAGPYGLSIAAHLKPQGVNFRIFGHPMHTWLTHMPKGMRLKSEGFASSLYDPESSFTLENYCKEKGFAYARIGVPVPLEIFSSYGLEFQKRFVPELESQLVVRLERTVGGFRVGLEDGTSVSARRVVLALGLTYYRYVPPILAALPEEFVTHSSKHSALDKFTGREVAVVGAGSSALDLAALLHKVGAHVQVLARRQAIRFHDPPGKNELEPSFMDRLRYPVTGIGPGWKLFFCANAPLAFRQLPQEMRLDMVRRLLGPAPCWFTKDEVVGKVPFNVGVNIMDAKIQNNRINLELADGSGTRKMLMTDHVIAATGYKVDLRRLSFLSADLQSGILAVEHTPVLSSNFECSVRGLYFVGISAANTFGPLLRFAFGAGFTARRLSRHLAKSAPRKTMPSRSTESTELTTREEVGVQ